jgi:hypothetical protein
MVAPQPPALIIIDVPKAIDDPRGMRHGQRNNPDGERNIARLFEAWRGRGLPIYHVRHDSLEPDSAYRPVSRQRVQAGSGAARGRIDHRQTNQQARSSARVWNCDSEPRATIRWSSAALSPITPWKPQCAWLPHQLVQAESPARELLLRRLRGGPARRLLRSPNLPRRE